MADDRKTSKPSYAKALLVPALTVGAGLGAGYFAGGAAAKGILSSKRVQAKLLRMSPAKRARWRANIRRGAYATGLAAGAGTSYLTKSYVHDQIDRLKNREKAKEKTAAVYSACIACLMESV